MTPFGIRKRLKNALKSALGMDEPAPPVRPAPTPAARPAPKAAPKAAPTPAPKAPPAPAAPRPSIGASPPPDSGVGGTMWVQAARMDEVVPGTARVVSIFGTQYALYEVDGELFASKNACPHAGGALGEGDLDGCTITCPFHAFQYDVRTGECLGGQADALATVRVKVDRELVLLEV